MEPHKVDIGAVQETLLIPLHARAVETRKKRPLIRDPKAAGLVDSLDYDFDQFDRGVKLLTMIFRGEVFDDWIRRFLAEHEYGTVIEIGVGLNTRYERLDNGKATWIELDLPDVISLRRKLFEETDRRSMIEGSVAEDGWVAAVKAAPAPYLFVAEAVLIYLSESDARTAIGTMTSNFPSATLLMDTAGNKATSGMQSDEAFKQRNVTFDWSCEDPRSLEKWGMRLLERKTILDVPPRFYRRLSLPVRALIGVIRRISSGNIYYLNRFELERSAEKP